MAVSLVLLSVLAVSALLLFTTAASAASDTILITQVSGLTYHFTVQANGTAVTSVSWDFGDGKTASGNSVYHSYAVSGNYTVTAIVTKATGTETLTKDLVISSGPSLIAYAFAVASIILLLAAAAVRHEPTKFWLAVSGVALMIYELSPYWLFGQLAFGQLVTGIDLLIAGFACLVVAMAPTRRRDRARGGWLLLGVIALVAYYVLIYSGL